MSCVFCAVVAGESPAIKIYENADYLAILDIRPFTRGHTRTSATTTTAAATVWFNSGECPR